MPTYKNMDVCLPILKQKKEAAKSLVERAGIQIAIEIITALPQEQVEEGVICRDCFFYDREKKKCNHLRGLIGRIKPRMFCSFGSRDYSASSDDLPEDDFSEFDEEEDE